MRRPPIPAISGSGITTSSRRGSSVWVGALVVGPITVTGDVELQDYSQIKYKDDPPDGWNTKGEANRDIRQMYRSTLNYHVGGEVTIPGTDLCLRGGYAVYPSPREDALASWDRKVVSFGAGFSFDKQFQIDAAYAQSSWDNEAGWMLDEEKLQSKKVMVTLSYSI